MLNTTNKQHKKQYMLSSFKVLPNNSSIDTVIPNTTQSHPLTHQNTYKPATSTDQCLPHTLTLDTHRQKPIE